MKTFTTDHYFHIGSMHYRRGLPCQDYALSISSSSSAIAVVSDGCSSGRHTDIGARIETLSLLETIRTIPKDVSRSFEDSVRTISGIRKERVRMAKSMLGLSRSDMLATSVYAYIDERGGFVYLEGDGVVVKKYRDGRITARLYEWDSNTPFYPSYGDEDLTEFVELHGGDMDSLRLKCTTIELDKDAMYDEVQEKQYTLKQGMSGITEIISRDELDVLECVLVSTDGVAQIEDTGWIDAVLEFTSYKSLEGEFVKRRMISALRMFERDGKKSLDDIAVAVIRIKEEVEDVEEH